MKTENGLRNLPIELARVQVEMESHARNYGLDFFPTIFEMVDADQLSAIAAYGGFPTRYPHWRFGMEYEQLRKGYAYGLQKIYELVINNDPCYAYLLDSNSFADHKLVIAHVLGHCDFFKNNEWYRHTSRKMMDEMANHGNRIRRYMDRLGIDAVEQFIDCCLSIENLIDIHSPFIQRQRKSGRSEIEKQDDDESPSSTDRLQTKSYLSPFMERAETIDERTERNRVKALEDSKTPASPTKDVMLYILEHAPLAPWQLDVMSIIRDEAYYFAPQGQTKIMNEGWATYWHTTIMARHGLDPADLICYADHCAGTLAVSQQHLNPYKLGLELFRDIEERWDKGRFGQQYDRCADRHAKEHWNKELGLGREKIFEVRRIHNDLTFIDEFLTLEFCQRNQMFSFQYNENTNHYEIESRRFHEIKQQLLWNLTNGGRPIIAVVDGNFENRGELFLEHDFQGVELRMDYVQDTLANLMQLWRRPVHIKTVLSQEDVTLSFDGDDTTVRSKEGVLPLNVTPTKTAK